MTLGNASPGCSAAEAPNDRLAAFRAPGFLRYWLALLCAGFSVQIQVVAIGWQVYGLTRNPLDLGLIGLSQFAPALVLVLVTGAVADRFPRRTILSVCLLLESTCAAGLLLFTLSGSTNVLIVYALVVVLGTARAFYNPARQSLVPNLVPREHLANAVNLATMTAHITVIGGPVAGGLLYGIWPELAYGTAFVLLIIGSILIAAIPKPLQARSAAGTSWAMLSTGFRFIWTEKIVLGAISLDLFVVLLGGAVALLPVYASDILDAGPTGLGLLRAGQGIGAVAVAGCLILWPVRDRAGSALFLAVAGFGVATAVFAVSEIIWVSVVMLIIMGGCDMVSVYVRNTLVQLWTPDELRGRVNAVNQVFIGASNELGAFRAGTMAAVIGPVAAVLAGGVGALAVTGLWARWFPELRQIRRLDGTA